MLLDRKFFLILFSLLTFLLTSCGLAKKNDTNNQDVAVEVSPVLGVKAIAPVDVLYIPTSDQKEQIVKNSSSFFSLKSDSKNSASIYRSTGSGGLGDDLNHVDSLNPYDGIPINIVKDVVEPTISISSDGDKGCSNIFSYADNLIKIDVSTVTVLTVCNLKVTATGATKGGNILTQSATFPVSINPTMKAYAAKNDTTVKYLQAYSSLSDIKLIAKWVKDANQSSNLNLKFDPVKTNGIKQRLSDVNALTGAQNVKSLDLSGTDLKDLRAVILLNNVEKLDISDTKVDPKDLALLVQMPKLTSLAVRNLNIKNITFITNNLKNLVELDISGNNQISDLEDIQNLSNLRVLKASSTGINDLSELTNFTQLTSLDVSNNDLSGLTVNDVNLLVNLFNVTELNFSKTKIKDNFLNAYFDAISNRNSIKKLVIRNYFDRSVNGNCDKINIIDSIPSLSNLTNIEYLDLHGNGCNNDSGFFQKGLTNTAFFSRMPNLQYLDISDTAIWDLSGVLRLRNLKQLKLWDKDGGISMSKDQCLNGLQDAAVVGIASDCYLLGKGTLQSKSFSPGVYTWKVPRNVKLVSLTGASGANGGSGGGGGGGGACYFLGNWANYTQGGSGGASGLANSVSRSGGAGGGRCNPLRLNHVSTSGTNGGDGGIGGITQFASQSFPLADQYTSTEPGTSLRGGSGGAGGGGGAEANSAKCGESGGAGYGGSGGSGSNGYNVKIKEFKQISVTPGDEIKIVVGAGGAAGAGGGGGNTGGCNDAGGGGSSGSSGTAGADGFLKIEWEE